jgi:pyruvate,orthophosphate dikinase
MRNLLGGKGANLAEMANLGLPVPPGFTLTTEVCTAFYSNGQTMPDGVERQVALQEYRQALLAVPQQPGFPDQVIWPTKPSWL